jgi:hypothetical protein
MKAVLLLLLGLNLVSCASYFTRKNCEATNWFEYGKNVALEGRRLSGDAFIQQCYKADGDVAESEVDRGWKSGAEIYCQPETAYATGRNGNFFSRDFCAPQGMAVLLKRHGEGVVAYCQKSNGYAAGATGRVYNKICPGSLEAAFMPEFNRGRKKFLQTEVSENEREISEIDRENSRLTTNLRLAQLQYMQYSGVTVSPGELDRGAQLRNNITQLQSQIRSNESRAGNLREKNKKIRLEMVQLD